MSNDEIAAFPWYRCICGPSDALVYCGWCAMPLPVVFFIPNVLHIRWWMIDASYSIMFSLLSFSED